jgi:DNA-binding NarL/FixJ family response regulator
LHGKFCQQDLPRRQSVGSNTARRLKSSDAQASTTRHHAPGTDGRTVATGKWQQLASSLVEAGQIERCRLAERLHGELQQLLTVALMRTWAAKRLTDDDKVRSVLAEVEDVVRRSVDETRSLTLELSPPILRHGSLSKAIEWLAERVLVDYGVDLDISVPRTLPAVPNPQKVFLFNLVTDCLMERLAAGPVQKARLVIRHQAGNMSIVLSGKDAAGAATAGNGKPGGKAARIGDRVAAVGGSMQVATHPHGFRAEFVIPANALADAAADSIRMIPTTAAQPPAASPPIETPPGVVRILLAEDHRMVREGLARLINREPDLYVIAEARDGQQAVDLAAEVNPDVVVLDVNMPVRNGSDAARAIRSRSDRIRIVALSEYGDAVTQRAMREAGANAYLCKDEAAEELCRVIRSVFGRHSQNGRRRGRASARHAVSTRPKKPKSPDPKPVPQP